MYIYMYNIHINPFSITSTVYTVQYIVIIIATVHVLQYCQLWLEKKGGLSVSE